jgi:pimeloyl-ACP methyl ester carboxylesterase
MATTITTDDIEIYVEQVGEGPDVLLIGGLGDTVESWAFQLEGLADRYRLTAFDNRGAGRTAMPEAATTVEAMADDAAGVLRALGITSAHVAGFSGGSIISQELALRHPELVHGLPRLRGDRLDRVRVRQPVRHRDQGAEPRGDRDRPASTGVTGRVTGRVAPCLQPRSRAGWARHGRPKGRASS